MTTHWQEEHGFNQAEPLAADLRDWSTLNIFSTTSDVESCLSS